MILRAQIFISTIFAQLSSTQSMREARYAEPHNLNFSPKVPSLQLLENIYVCIFQIQIYIK